MQDGVERPIAYASRQLNSAEQAYTASEIEMLALVWATKYFRCYLHGTKFIVTTDHSALTYLRNFADHNSRLLRWNLRLSELDFVVEHRPGTKIAHVHVLSRHVGTVTVNNSLDKVNILQEQKKDAFCTKQTTGSYSSNSDFFLDNEGAHSTTGISPFFMLHGREIILHSHEDLKARVTGENLDHKRQLENLKISLKTAYTTVAKVNRSSRQNKKLYSRKAKTRKSEVEESVYLYNPSTKPGRS